MQQSFIKRIWTKPPALFPWVALFHVLMLCYSAWSYREFPFPSEYWIPTLWLLLFLISWLFTCNLKRWASLTYLGLTSLNLALVYLLKSSTDRAIYLPPFFAIYVVFSFFILIYYKRFNE